MKPCVEPDAVSPGSTHGSDDIAVGWRERGEL